MAWAEDPTTPIIVAAEDEEEADEMGIGTKGEEVVEDREGMVTHRAHPTSLTIAQSHVDIPAKNGKASLKPNETVYIERGRGLKQYKLLLQC
jgi:hypothetical protein